MRSKRRSTPRSKPRSSRRSKLRNRLRSSLRSRTRSVAALTVQTARARKVRGRSARRTARKHARTRSSRLPLPRLNPRPAHARPHIHRVSPRVHLSQIVPSLVWTAPAAAVAGSLDLSRSAPLSLLIYLSPHSLFVSNVMRAHVSFLSAISTPLVRSSAPLPVSTRGHLPCAVLTARSAFNVTTPDLCEVATSVVANQGAPLSVVCRSATTALSGVVTTAIGPVSSEPRRVGPRCMTQGRW